MLKIADPESTLAVEWSLELLCCLYCGSGTMSCFDLMHEPYIAHSDVVLLCKTYKQQHYTEVCRVDRRWPCHAATVSHTSLNI